MSSVIVGGLVIGVVGLVGAALMDWVNLPVFNKKTLLGWLDQGTAQVTGFTPAKTPQEAMDKFREAVEGRKYTFAAKYCTKSYADMLNRVGTPAAELGASIDTIRNYAKNKGLLTDKTAFLLHQLDPFPKNLKSGTPPAEKNGKTYATYTFEATTFTASPEKLTGELVNLDRRMFQTVLAPRPIFGSPIELVKEGEEWKLNIITTPDWELAVGYFNDNWKAYLTGMDSFSGSMMNNRFDSPAAFEEEVVAKLRGAKK